VRVGVRPTFSSVTMNPGMAASAAATIQNAATRVIIRIVVPECPRPARLRENGSTAALVPSE